MSKMPQHATVVVDRPNGDKVVVFHETEIVTIRRDRTVVLDSGGWLTSTTKTRMNQAAEEFGLNFKVFQEKKQWFVMIPGGTLPFQDGMVI